jgi:hypothetical protein
MQVSAGARVSLLMITALAASAACGPPEPNVVRAPLAGPNDAAPSNALPAKGPDAPFGPAARAPERGEGPNLLGDDELIGIEECDLYVTSYEACLERAGLENQEAAVRALRTQRDAFRKAAETASTPEARRSVARSCRAAHDAIRTACP